MANTEDYERRAGPWGASRGPRPPPRTPAPRWLLLCVPPGAGVLGEGSGISLAGSVSSRLPCNTRPTQPAASRPHPLHIVAPGYAPQHSRQVTPRLSCVGICLLPVSPTRASVSLGRQTSGRCCSPTAWHTASCRLAEVHWGQTLRRPLL